MENQKHLIPGPISPIFISEMIEEHQSKKTIGAHSMFLGTVRADVLGEKTVLGIEYSAYEEMITATIREIKDSLFASYKDLICIHIFHSIGLVKAGKHSLFVLVSGRHRKQAFRACEECVDLIKEKLPVWKKEIYSDQSYTWTDH